MKRRVFTIALVLMMALSIIPMTASAESDDAATQLYNRTRRSYVSSLAAYGKSSFHGYCATLVAYQLRYSGITKSAEMCNGNEMYDRYADKEITTGGYYIHAYSAKEYNTLEQTLNVISQNGTKDVYNILVGFQWTNTAAGRKYGHTVFINGILDGIVYFTESFTSATIGSEGTVGQLTIAQFAKMYDSWTRFEGCIYFTKNYGESLENWQTDLLVRARFSAQLRSQPCLVGQQDCQLLRSVYVGERLLVTGIVRDEDGQWYYAVQDGDYTGYIVAQATILEQVGTTTAAGVVRERFYVVEDRLESEIVLEIPQMVMMRSTVQPDGWTCRDGKWYYYENGQARTGWFMEHGVRYYFDETGAAATGWTVISGQTCLFSATGALCTGWIRDTDGMRYCSFDGRFANEFQSIDGVLYYFQEGLLQSSGIVTDGTELYRVQPDGRAVLITEF